MKAIAVDDEIYMLETLQEAVCVSPDIERVEAFSSCSAALAYATENPVDIAFLDINMRGIGGLGLAEKLLELQPRCKIIFCTGYEEYAVSAFHLHVSGDLMKPITQDAVEKENDHSKGDVKDDIPFQPNYEQQDEVFNVFVERYPNIKCIARHVRYSHSGSENSLKAYMWYEGHTFESKLFRFNILDRVGGGDSFASGLIYALMHNYKPMDIINFAVASSVIKHTIRGDGNVTDDAETIRNLMNMNYDIAR